MKQISPMLKDNILSLLDQKSAKDQLFYFMQSEWICVQKPEYDCIYDNEPLKALALCLSMKNGTFKAKLWGKTVMQGKFGTVEKVEKILVDFLTLKPCLGLPSKNHSVGTVKISWPFERYASNHCQWITNDGSETCQNCRVAQEDETQNCHDCDSRFGDLLKSLEELKDHISLLHAEKILEDTKDGVVGDIEFEAKDVSSEKDVEDRYDSDFDINADLLETVFESDGNSGSDNNRPEEEPEDVIKSEGEDSDDSDFQPLSQKKKRKKKRKTTSRKEEKKPRGNPEDFSGECTKCIMHYKSAYQLEKHMKSDHMKDEYFCPVCASAFKFPDDLVNHMPSCNADHNGLSCPECQVSIEVPFFYEHVSRCKRSLSHHKSSGEIMCDFCSKFFTCPKDLEEHTKREHISFSCSLCPEFTTESPKELEEHTLVNHGDLMSHLTCGICKIDVPIASYHSWFQNHFELCKLRKRNISNDKKLVEGPLELERTCHVCEDSFQFPTSLKFHLESQHAYSILTCLYCSDKFETTLELQKHLGDEHENVEAITCIFCCQKVGVADMLNHFAACFEDKFPGNKYAKTAISCTLCSKTFLRNNEALAHIKHDHLGILNVEPKNQTDDGVEKKKASRNDNDQQSFVCPEEGCPYTTKKSELFRQHTNRHKQKKAGTLKKRVIPKIPCELCGKVIGKGAMVNHLKFVHKQGSDEAACSECDRVFDRFSSLQQHIRRDHQSVDSYKCEFCEKSFGTSSEKRKHIARKHQSPEFTCDVCGKAFSMETSLKIHERTHTGDKPYQCDICDAAYISYASLAKHKASKHLR